LFLAGFFVVSDHTPQTAQDTSALFGHLTTPSPSETVTHPLLDPPPAANYSPWSYDQDNDEKKENPFSASDIPYVQCTSIR
jgi:hypothetical protein